VIAWLRNDRGVRVRVTPEGVTLGRDPRCRVVVTEPTASRRHALVVLSSGGVTMLPLGEHPIVVNGASHGAPVTVKHGDVIAIPGVELTVELERGARGDPAWVLEIDGHAYHVRGQRFALGGDEGDDLNVASWPGRAATLCAVDGGMVLDTEHAMTLAGRLTEPGQHPIASGDMLAFNGVSVKLVARDARLASTLGQRPKAHLPTAVELEFVPNGGLMRTTTSTVTTVWLPDKRCDLCAVLLQPPGDIAPGDYVPDEVITPRVWQNSSAGRVQLNTLVYRLRKTLTAAGLSGPALIERARGGGATRFALAPGARVSVC
jgi:hypothetical protein